MLTDIKTEMLTDMKTEMLTDIKTEMPTDIKTEMPTEKQAALSRPNSQLQTPTLAEQPTLQLQSQQSTVSQ